jgi:hypothetical protein
MPNTRPLVLLVAFTFLTASCRTQPAPARNQNPSASADPSAFLPADFFPIMTWELPPASDPLLSDPHAGLTSLAECGFTTAGFVRPHHLKECERLGLKAIVCPAGPRVDWTKLSDQQIEQTIRDLVKESGDSPAVIGYFLRDEPGVNQFPALAKAVAAVKKFAPGKLAYINLYPITPPSTIRNWLPNSAPPATPTTSSATSRWSSRR